MLSDYGYIGILLVVAILFTIAMPVIPFILGFFGIVPRKSNPVKNSTYECGMQTIGKGWLQFNFRSYYFAVLFVALDVISVFLYPWAVVFKDSGLPAFIAIIVFFCIVMVGYIYAWVKGALDWK